MLELVENIDRPPCPLVVCDGIDQQKERDGERVKQTDKQSQREDETKKFGEREGVEIETDRQRNRKRQREGQF